MCFNRCPLFPDVDRGEILSTIRRNFELNSDLLRQDADDSGISCDDGVACDVSVAEIDFFGDDWKSNLSDQLRQVEVVVVADVVYEPDLTRKFFSALRHVVTETSRDVTVFFSIEKRNRVDESGTVTAPNFVIFVDLLDKFSAETGSRLIRISPDFEQRFKCYDRVEELFMWRLDLKKRAD